MAFLYVFKYKICSNTPTTIAYTSIDIHCLAYSVIIKTNTICLYIRFMFVCVDCVLKK